MLTEIKLTNFKCFKEETSIPLSRFNLFTGVNGAGKSTALQALLLMRQSIDHNPFTTELILNGNCVSLGSFEDVMNIDVSKTKAIFLEFCIENEGEKSDFYASITYHLENNDMTLHISNICVKQKKFKSKGYTDDFFEKIEEKVTNSISLEYCDNGIYKPKVSSDIIEKFILKKLTPLHFDKLFSISTPTDIERYRKSIITDDGNSSFSIPLKDDELYVFFENTQDSKNNDNLNFERIHFISADRIGPREFYQKTILPEFPNVGRNGEFAVSLLNMKAQELVNEDLCLGEDAKTLITQTEAWLGKILNPLSLQAKSLGKTNFLELLIGGFKPSNVGFGYSSILPIIVTGLIAKPNEKIIIENPEIHLHPKAQSALIEFLVKVANTGVQIFIESHSDHVLNALRIATKNKLLKPDDVNILFFAQENGNSKIIKPTIDENGRISEWPESFFDETAKSLASLAAGQRPRMKAPKAEI